MWKPRLVIKPSPRATRLLLTSIEGEQLKAVLPPPTAIHPRAAQTLLEGLSLWLGRPLSIVLCADAEGTSSALCLRRVRLRSGDDPLRGRGRGPPKAGSPSWFIR